MTPCECPYTLTGALPPVPRYPPQRRRPHTPAPGGTPERHRWHPGLDGGVNEPSRTAPGRAAPPRVVGGRPVDQHKRRLGPTRPVRDLGAIPRRDAGLGLRLGGQFCARLPLACIGIGLQPGQVLGRDVKGGSAPLIYLLGIIGSLLWVWLGIAAYVLVAAMWLNPDRRMEDYIDASRTRCD
jgi:hypothetical protein